MKFNSLSEPHLKSLATLVPADRFSTGESILDLHAKDQSPHPACRPEAVIWPETASEVAAVLRFANEHRVPVTGWGSGSSLEGNPIPVQKGIVLDFSRMNRIIAVREEDFQVDVQPGVVYQDLNEKLRHTGLFFPPDPGARAPGISGWLFAERATLSAPDARFDRLLYPIHDVETYLRSRAPEDLLASPASRLPRTGT